MMRATYSVGLLFTYCRRVYVGRCERVAFEHFDYGIFHEIYVERQYTPT